LNQPFAQSLNADFHIGIIKDCAASPASIEKDLRQTAVTSILGVLGKAKSQGGPMRLLLALILPAIVGLASPARADDFSLTIKDHRFEPAELEVPAGKDLTLNVTNADATAEEFESNDFDAEKVITGGQTAVIKIGPLDPGRYEFYGEYHEDSAKGALVAK
jgi:plastocyanin